MAPRPSALTLDWLSARARTIAKGSIAFLISRLVTLLVTFATVPVAFNYLGPERYGVWMVTASSVMIVLSLADGGVSNALITATARSRATAGNLELRALVGSAFAIFSSLAVVIILAGVVIANAVPWKWVLNLHSDDIAGEARTIAIILISGVALGGLVNIAFRLRTGLEQIPAAKVWDTVAESMVLPAFLVAVRLDAGMIWLVAAGVFVPLLVRAFGSSWFFYRMPHLLPSWGEFSYARASELLGGGFALLLMALASALSLQAGPILIAKLVRVEEAGTYAMLSRLFMLPWVFVNFVVYAQWPTYAAAAARGEFDWVKSSFWKTKTLALALTLVATVILALWNWQILRLWIGADIHLAPILVASIIPYALTTVAWGVLSVLLVSLDARRLIMAINLAVIIAIVPLSAALIHQMGVAGAAVGAAATYLICAIGPAVLSLSRILKARQDIPARRVAELPDWRTRSAKVGRA